MVPAGYVLILLSLQGYVGMSRHAHTNFCDDRSLFLDIKPEPLLRCSAYNLNCTVTQNGNLTNYKIINTNNVNLNDCPYQWLNGTDHVIANEKGQMNGLVVKNSINLLVTSKCSNTTFLIRTCTTEDEQRTAMCNTTCRENAPDDGDMKASTNYWIGLVVLLLLLMGVLGFVCFKNKDTICRLCSRPQCRCRYPAANMQKSPTDGPSAVPLV